MNGRTQNLIIVLGLLILVYFGYYLYSNNESASLSIENGDVATQVAADGAEFLQRLNELKSIKLDGSIFSDPDFQSLEDNTQVVTESAVGRDNPFLPIE